MGNIYTIQAAAPLKQVESTTISPPITASAPAVPPQQKEQNQSSAQSKNPGVYEDLHKKCKGTYISYFDFI